MTARRDPDRLIRTYLDDGPTELADRSYYAVRAQIDHTRQRVVVGPWREPDMSRYIAFAMAAAAVLAVAVVVGVNFMPQGGQVGTADPSPTTAASLTPPPTSSPRATPPPTSSPRATASPSLLPLSGDLAAGRYFRNEGTIRIAFTVPAGWTVSEGSFLYKDRDQPGEVMFTTWLVTHIFSDACQWDPSGGLVDVGTTVDELVEALANQDGREASTPTDVTVSGFTGKRIELTVPADLDTSTCSSENLRYWPGAGPDLRSGLCCNPAGNTDAVYVVDVDGHRPVLIARHYPESSRQNRAELRAIVDSIQIEP